LIPERQCIVDIVLLTRLAAAAEQNDQRVAVSPQIDSPTCAVIDLEFANA
jgi:hypothetical protein